MNRPVLERAIYWDESLRRHPRRLGWLLFGAGLVLAAYAAWA